MYALIWHDAALDRLADVFVRIDLHDQDRLTAAVETLNRQLVLDPFEVGESRADGFRLTFLGAVMVLFRVDHARQLVRVTDVGLFGL